jgi:hypothetical protein
LLDLFHGLLQAEGRAVGTVVGHGIHHIGHRHDAGRRDDPATFQPLGITRAIHALMVLEGSLGNRPGEVDPLEDLISRLGVHLDE